MVGAIYDFINALGKGFGRVAITNINGIKEKEKIRKLAQGIDLEQCLGRVNLD